MNKAGVSVEQRELKLRLLKSTDLFRGEPEEKLAALLDKFTLLEAKAGESIFKKGDFGNCLYVVAEGRVRVHDEERVLNDLHPFDMFGEMAAIDPEPRSASVTALEASRLLLLDQEGLFALMAQHPGLTHSILRLLIQRLRARVRDMAEDYEYMQQFSRVIGAALAVEAGVYQPESLDEVARREDGLGQLARVFQGMVRQVSQREQRLKQEVAELRIEIDEAKQASQVAEITETEYFHNLKARARQMRTRRSP